MLPPAKTDQLYVNRSGRTTLREKMENYVLRKATGRSSSENNNTLQIIPGGVNTGIINFHFAFYRQIQNPEGHDVVHHHLRALLMVPQRNQK